MDLNSRQRDDINVAFHVRDDFFRDIFNAVQTGLLIIDPDTHIILDANEAAVAMIGEAKDHVVGSVCHTFICPAEKGHCPITDLHQTVDRSERVLLQAHGKKIPIIKSVGFISIAGQRYLLENFIDNTEHKKAEIHARENERKIRAIFDQTFQFIGILTTDGILTDANRSALKFSGIEESAVIGKPFWETPWWTHSTDLQDRLKIAIAVAAKGEFIRFEATHPATDGTIHYVDFSLKPVMDEAGKVIYLIPEGRDITDRKKIEDELHRKNDDLYAAYEQLTATEEEIRQNYEELARNERKLLESERKIRAIFDQTFQFIGSLSLDGILTDVNRSALKFSGIEESAVIGKPFWDTPWWSHSPQLREQVKKAISSAAKGIFIRFEATHPAADGTIHYVDFSLKPVMDEAGKVIYLIPEGRDITDRKKIEDELHLKNDDLYAAYEQLTATEEELRQNYEKLSKQEKDLIESERKIRAVFDQTFQFIALLSPEGILLDTNRSAMNSHAIDVSHLLNKKFWEMPWLLHSPEQQERIRAAVHSAATGTFVRFEAQQITDSGACLHFDVSIKPVKDDHGTIVYLIAESRDITDLKMTTRALVESENIYRAIFGNTGTAMALIEENTLISLINAEFEKMSGYLREDVVGKKSWTEFVVPEDLERMLAQHKLRREQGGGAQTHYEFRLIAKNGEIRDIFLSIDIIPGTKKSVASLMDITENKRMTKQLSASLLEKEVLLREIHHRVKNNLQIIISLLNLQSRQVKDKTVLSVIQESQNRVRAMALVHEKIYQSEHLSEIDITDYISYLSKYLFQFYGTERRSIKLVLEGSCIKVGINTAVPLGLVINELVSNSLKHAFPQGGPGKVMIGMQRDDEGIVITVKDDGVGMPECIETGNTDSLGLMLIQNLGNQLGAEISLDRQCGTAYTIRIPSDRIQ